MSDTTTPQANSRGRGRPGGKLYPIETYARMTVRDKDRLAQLAEKWELTEAGAVRRCIKECAEREGILP